MKKLLATLLVFVTTITSFAACDLTSFTSNQTSQNESTDSRNENTVEKLNMLKLAENIDGIAQYDISNNKVFGSAYFVYQDGDCLGCVLLPMMLIHFYR